MTDDRWFSETLRVHAYVREILLIIICHPSSVIKLFLQHLLSVDDDNALVVGSDLLSGEVVDGSVSILGTE